METLKEQIYYSTLNLDAVGSIEDDVVTFKKNITYKGTQYEIDFFLLTKNLQLYKMVDIFITGEQQVYFLCVKCKLVNFCNHFQSYLVLESKDSLFFAFSPSYFDYYSPIHTYILPNGNTYLRPKYF